MKKLTKPSPVTPSFTLPTFTKSDGLPDAGSAPTIRKFDRATIDNVQYVIIEGTNFDNNTTVTIGAATAVIEERNATHLKVVLEPGTSGTILVANTHSSVKSGSSITYLDPPIISSIAGKLSGGSTVVIGGSNFVTGTVVYFGDKKANNITVVNDKTITAVVPLSASGDAVKVETPGGSDTEDGKKDLQGEADFTLPISGDGITIIPTPKFSYSQRFHESTWGFDANVWGNVLGTDSNLQKVASNLLMPQISLLGLKANLLWRITKSTSSSGFAWVFQTNFLLKKVAYYDTTSKDLTAFNPFVFHPKLGFTSSFFKKNFFLGAYLNVMSVLTEVRNFKSFFNDKSIFVYPDFNIGGLFNISDGGAQQLKFDFNFIVNTSSTRHIFNNGDRIIPYVRFGLVSDL